MSSTNLLRYLGQDFAEFISEFLPEKDTSGDLYLEIISRLMGAGDNPTEESVLEFFHSKDGLSNLASELNSWHETSAFDLKVVRNLMTCTIRNNLGREIAERLQRDSN